VAQSSHTLSQYTTIVIQAMFAVCTARHEPNSSHLHYLLLITYRWCNLILFCDRVDCLY